MLGKRKIKKLSSRKRKRRRKGEREIMKREKLEEKN